MTSPTAPTTAQQLAELRTRVEALEAWRTHHTDLLDELLNGPDPSLGDPDAGDRLGDAGGEPEPLDTDALIAWVHHTITSMIARPLRGELAWCPLWWEHSEALFRFEALRRAWTELAPEPGAAMSIWIRDHLDPCLRELLSPIGPFADCRHTDRARSSLGHTPVPPLPTRTPA